MTIGEQLREMRLQRSLSQDELGQQVQVDGRQISRYENGRVRPSAKVLRRYAQVFDVPLDELMALSQGSNGSNKEAPFQDGDLYAQFLQIDRLDEEDRYVAKRVLQALLMKKQLEDMLVQQPARRRVSRQAS